VIRPGADGSKPTTFRAAAHFGPDDSQESEVRAMYDIGEKPGVGRYCCSNGCGWSVYLDNASDVLPPCGSCGRGQQVKYYRC
jgi:hypothetical protein